MLPIQEIKISTKNGREFFVHLEKWQEDRFDCKIAALNLGPQSHADATFGPFCKGKSANEAFKSLIEQLSNSLSKLDNTDEIAVIDNPCNTEFVNMIEQQNIVNCSISILVNGK